MMRIPLWRDEQELTAAMARNARLVQFRQEDSTPLFGGDVEARLNEAGTAAIRVGKCGFAGVLRVSGNQVEVLEADHSVATLPVEWLVDSLLESAAGDALAQIDDLLAPCKMAPHRRAAARRAILSEHLRATPVGTMRRLSFDSGDSNRRQFRDTGLPGMVAAFLAAHLAEACVWLAIWQLVARGSLSGRLDMGWMWGWTLLLAALIPVRAWAARSLGRLSIGVGGLLKQRLLAGALRLSADDLAREGAGGFSSRLAVAQEVEALALSGGLASLISIVELAMASALLTIGASAGSLLAVFLAWALLAVVVGGRYACERDRWTIARFSMTRDPTGQMTADGDHIHQDSGPGQCHGTSERMDRRSGRLNSFGPAAWLLVGVLGLVPAFSSGASPAKLAIGLGGVLLAYQALRSALRGVSNLMEAAISWRSAASLSGAAEDIQPAGVVDTLRYRPDGPAVVAHR